MSAQVFPSEKYELVNLLIEKMKGVLKVREDDLSVRRDDEEPGVFHIEFGRPIAVKYEDFRELERDIEKLGFEPIDNEVRTLVKNNGYRKYDEIEEYINDERVRIILVYEDEIMGDRRLIYLKKITIGNISVVENPATLAVNNLIEKLDELGIKYEHYIESPYQVIKVKARLVYLHNNEEFEFRYNNCISIIVKEWKGNRPEFIRILNECRGEVEEKLVSTVFRMSITYEDGTLYIRSYHG
jgi:hypothetical protein